MLLAIGRWLQINGEAIYDTRPFKVYGEGPTAVESGSFTDTKRQGFTGQDIRFTTKGDALYALLMAWPENGEATVQTLASGLRVYTDEIDSVELLGSNTELKWSRTARGLKVKLPEEKPYDHAYALKITPRI